MKLRSLLILLILLFSLLPAYSFNRYLQRVLRPRESAGRLFLFLLANFVFVVVYTILIVGLIIRLFPAPFHGIT
jgi:hypothetical protein